MNIDCCVIGDLLPLYADESCSDASRALVDDHLKTCPRCRETLARMKSEQFLPAAQAIDPPAVADYAQKVKHRRQKRGTLLTVGVIVLIVLLSLAAAAWMNLVRAQHPYIPVVEESVCNLAAGEVHQRQVIGRSCFYGGFGLGRTQRIHLICPENDVPASRGGIQLLQSIQPDID